MCLPVDQHLLTISAPAIIEFEVEATCCSQTEWEIAPAFEEYRQRLRFDHWLMVPPLFSPVKKVNYLITGEEDQEVLQLEVWTTKSANASSLLRLASASLLAGLEARKGQISVPEPSELPGMRHANPPSGPLQGDDALAELLNSVQNDPSLISAGAAERDEDLSTLTQGLFDEQQQFGPHGLCMNEETEKGTEDRGRQAPVMEAGTDKRQGKESPKLPEAVPMSSMPMPLPGKGKAPPVYNPGGSPTSQASAAPKKKGWRDRKMDDWLSARFNGQPPATPTGSMGLAGDESEWLGDDGYEESDRPKRKGGKSKGNGKDGGKADRKGGKGKAKGGRGNGGGNYWRGA
eukprot:g29871.t1